jgi:hypothetical protein
MEPLAEIYSLRGVRQVAGGSGGGQGLTLVHFTAQSKQLLRDTLRSVSDSITLNVSG